MSKGAGGASAAQRVYDELRWRMLSLDLAPDTTLSRVELAEQFEVSQTPIREALQRLEQDGLVRIVPQSRTVVTRIDIPQLYEAHFLRIALECEVVRRLALAPDAAPLPKLRTIVRMQEALVGDAPEIAMFNDLDEALHGALFEAAGQSGLFALARSKAVHLTRAQRLDLPKEGKMRTIIGGHGAVLDAIEARDPVAAQEAMRTHLTGTVDRIEALRTEFPDHFRS